jgi:hypothetical protein
MNVRLVAIAHMLAACTTTSDPYRDAVLADHPLAYWRLDDRIGARSAADELGRTPGSVVGQTSFGAAGATPATGRCATFGDNQWISAGDVFGFDAGEDFTIELWMYPDEIDINRPFLTKGDILGERTGYALLTTMSTGGPLLAMFVYNATSKTLLGVPLAAQTWTHVAVAMSGTVATVYTDGALAGPLTYSARWDPSVEPFTISSQSDGFHGGGSFDGQLDEVAVYGAALPAERIAAHYAAAK